METELRTGSWDRSVADALASWTLKDLREGDIEEYSDCMLFNGYSSRELTDLRTYLPLALGSLEQPRVYTVNAPSPASIDYGGNVAPELCIFVATLTKRTGSGIGLLRGAGLRLAHTLVGARRAQQITEQIIDNVLWDMTTIFGITMAVCHVKNTNTRTLASWRYQAKKRPQMYGAGGCEISFLPTPHVEGYTTVILEAI